LVTLAEDGAAGPDVLDRIKALRAEVETLQATPAPTPVFDRVAFFKRFTNKSLGMLVLPGSAQALRSALKKLGIDRVVPCPDGQGGWTFEDTADLTGALTSGALGERAG
jgi:hypothetical protein